MHNIFLYKFIRENGGWDNWSVILVEKFPCEDKLELLKKEREWTETLNANLNSIKGQGLLLELGETCYNNQYFNANKNTILEYSKQYRKDNKEKLLEKLKQYRENNKDKIKEYYIKNKDVILEKKKEYKRENKELISEKNKLYREKNRDKISKQIFCECGSFYTLLNKSRHMKTLTHQNFIKNQEEI